jgi:putative PEP-CTERM system histidine kinase
MVIDEGRRTPAGAHAMLLTNVGLVSHFIAAIAFFGLGVGAAARQRRRIGYVLAVASFLTSAWAVVFVLAARGDILAIRSLPLAETIRTTAWIAFLLAVLRRGWQLDERSRLSFLVAGGLGFAVALQLVLDALGVAASAYGGPPTVAGELFVISRLTVAMAGLVMAHNLYLQSVSSGRSGGRILAIGIGGILVYDLNLYTLAFLLPPVSPDLFNIRGAANTMTTPLLLLAAREAWVARVQVSRQVVFHTLSFSMIGFYLIAMAALAYGLRLAGGDWGLLLQVSFLFASAILGVVVLFSPRFRALLRVQIAKNFFAYKYDYRQEWPRFIATVSQTGSNAGTLQERVIQAVCAVVESPGGVLFIPDDVALTPAAEWQMKATSLAPVPNDSGLARYLSVRQRVIDFDEMRADTTRYDDAIMPYWAVADRRIWLGVPLIHLDALAGFLVIERSLVDRPLNWEDFELLRTLGRQAASYIAESSTQEALDEAGKFEEFNRRFAFIIHDVKNLVSQLSLVARNAERHADNPAFRADMVATLQSSVGKMNDLLARLAPRSTARTGMPTDQVDLVDLMGQVAAVKRLAHPTLALAPLSPDTRPQDYIIRGDPGRIEQLLLHLVQNAIDASTPDAPIDLAVRHTGETVVISIADKGEGMSQRFIAQELFRPFRSTKAGGFGIGAYEAREIARAHGGRLEVDSREGEGTVFRIVLPTTGAHQAVAAQ